MKNSAAPCARQIAEHEEQGGNRPVSKQDTVELIENAFFGRGECQDIHFSPAKLMFSIHSRWW
jgi:hypothetical protein